jgi:two-component system phosphate regulon sensor histidine kinase PhoR
VKATRSLFTLILLPLFAVTIAAVLVATSLALTVMRHFHMQETAEGLGVQARLIAKYLDRPFDPANAARTEAACKELGHLIHTRITVILASGKVLADSEQDPATMDNHADRPEVAQALAGRVGNARRYSDTLRSDWLYVAVPVANLGVLRASAPLASVYKALWRAFLTIGLGSIAVAVLAVLTVLLLTRRVARPLKEMELGARRFARGDFDQPLSVPRPTELASLAEAMNAMATVIRARIQAMEKQRNELQAVLSSMVEGVIAVDAQQRVMRINRAAATLFGTTPEIAQGRLIQEVVRNLRFHECVDRILTEQQPFEAELTTLGIKEAFLRVSAALLVDDCGGTIGATFVLNDVTEVRALERARSDFVANVSHEIRTPLTSIKGYAETLLNDRPSDPETLASFLDIIVRQSDRLCSLVDDILSLANLERAEVAGDVLLAAVSVRPLIETAVSVCAPKAAQKNLDIAIVCDDDIKVQVNELLFEQAVINLIDNAIKYSDAGHRINVVVVRNGGVCISVRDWGIGIAAEHVPRIFERFYRVDRGRSRKLGGTGLGLAIVKHIVALHNGQVSVESTLGKGSCFTIKMPAPRV